MHGNVVPLPMMVPGLLAAGGSGEAGGCGATERRMDAERQHSTGTNLRRWPAARPAPPL